MAEEDSLKPFPSWVRFKNVVRDGTTEFLGLSPAKDPCAQFNERRLRLVSRRCGCLKPRNGEFGTRSSATRGIDTLDYGIKSSSTKGPPEQIELRSAILSKQPTDITNISSFQDTSDLNNLSRDLVNKMRRESVPSMAWNGLRNLVTRKKRLSSRWEDTLDAMYKDVSLKSPQDKHRSMLSQSSHHPSHLKRSQSTQILSTLDDSFSYIPRIGSSNRLDTVDGKQPKPYLKNYHPPPFYLTQIADQSYTSKDDEVFIKSFNIQRPKLIQPIAHRRLSTLPQIQPTKEPTFGQKQKSPFSVVPVLKESTPLTKKTSQKTTHPFQPETDVNKKSNFATRLRQRFESYLHRNREDHSNRRYPAGGILMDIINDPGYSNTLWNNPQWIQDMIALEDFRPFFTYWITTLQTIILILALFLHGFGPVGFGMRHREKILLKPSLALEKAGYLEPENFWLGPNPFTLIHLGAKYSPCMRRDPLIFSEIDERIARESRSACCIRKDGSGCIQSVWQDCQDDRFFAWSHEQGPVCGLDPKYCANPLSSNLKPWSQDITFWPICKTPTYSIANTSNAVIQRNGGERYSRYSVLPSHLTCEIIGRPCCIGIRGACIITTQEYCSFVKGSFHAKANLCSQVDCLADVCGMLPFTTFSFRTSKSLSIKTDPQVSNSNQNYATKKVIKIPDQIYRLWISLFLQAGIVQLIVTVSFQIVIMRDLEKLAGPVRTGVLYFVSGVGGNLASAIFSPDRADVGPSGAQLGILACLVVELIQTWQILQSPWTALGKLASIYVILFLLGLLPWIDNYAHVFGFVFGALTSFCIMPYLTFGRWDRRRKLVTLVVSAITLVILYTILLVLFYVFPNTSYRCEWCKYLDCIPLQHRFCNNHEILINP